MTISDFIDITTFTMVVLIWSYDKYYEHGALKIEMFGPEEDNKDEIKFMLNMIYDITNGIFHFDYLMAGATALLWLRCAVLLRLTESFGPLTTMIVKMSYVVFEFFVLYIIGLIVFSCLATLTLHENPNFSNLQEALRTYIMASLGNFDLYQYDAMEESWQ